MVLLRVVLPCFKKIRLAERVFDGCDLFSLGELDGYEEGSESKSSSVTLNFIT